MTSFVFTGLAAMAVQAPYLPAANGPAGDEALARLKFKNSGIVRSDMRFEYRTQPCYYVESPTAWTVPWGGHAGNSSYPYPYLAAEGDASSGLPRTNSLTPPPVGMRSAVPLGGLGAGTVELRADGSLRDWNIFNNSPGGGGGKVQLDEALFGLRVQMAGGPAKAWTLRTQPPQGLPPIARIEYGGAYPVSRLRLSDPGLLLTVDLYAYSEFRIRDAAGSAAPAAIFSFRIGNPTAQAAEAAILFNLPNHPQGTFTSAGGLRLARAGDGPMTGAMVARFGGADRNASCAASDDPNAIWKEFAENGEFAALAQANAKHGATAATVMLRPGETKTFHMVMTWYFPSRTHAGNSQRVGNYYTKLYAGADDVADKVLARLSATWQAIGDWQQLCFDNALPDWLQDAMVNSVATMAKTGMWLEDGRWRQWESFSCPVVDPVHIHFYRSLPYALFFPELQQNEFRGYATHQQDDGFIFENLGDWDDLPAFFSGNGGKPLDQAGGRWMGDCTSAFILGVYKQYLWSGDRKGLDEFWPAAKKAAQWQIQRSGKFGLPEHLDNTYDWWGFAGKDVVAYNAVMHLAALRAAAVMAQVAGDAEFARACAEHLATGRKKLDQLLWTGEYYRAWWMEKGGQPEALHADTLYGQLWASVLGLGPVVDADKARAHLAAEMKYNRSPFGLKVMQRRGNDDVIDALVWQAGSLDWATLNIYLGGEVGMSLAEAGNMVNVWREHLRDPWDWRDLTRSDDGQPWCNSHYARQLILWALPLALSGQQYSAAEKRIAFTPATGAPRRLPWFTPQANGVLEILGQGGCRFTVLAGKLELKELQVAGSAPCKELQMGAGKTLDLTATASMTPARTDQMKAMLKLQPGIITNNRLGGNNPGDTYTSEQEVPPDGVPGKDWESCMTMGTHWGYNKNDKNLKSLTELIRTLIDIVSKGGNYLLNVGPTAEGLIPERNVQRLAEIGKWMKTNGEAIHGTIRSPFPLVPAWGRVTQKPGNLYLHVFDWPKDGMLKVPGLTAKVKNAYLLSDVNRVALKTAADAADVEVAVPAQAPDAVASVVVLKVEAKS